MVMLSCRKNELTKKNNYSVWSKQAVDVLAVKYPKVGTVLKTHEPFEVAPIADASWNPVLPPGMAMNAGERRELWLKAFVARTAELKAVEDEGKAFYRAVWATLSDESQTVVLGVAGSGGADGWATNERPNELCAAIRATHFTLENGADGPMMANMNLLVKEDAFKAFKQLPGVSIASFKTEFLEQVASLEAAGVAVDPQPLKAAKFLMKLDRARHQTMLVKLRNDAARGTPYPQTVDDAYALASTWTNAADGDGASIFILSDDVKPRAAPKPPAAATSGGGSGKGGPPRKPAATSATVTEGHPPPRKESAAAEAARLAYYKLRECDECHKVGHIARHCPDKKKKPHAAVHFTAAVGEDDDEDSIVCMMSCDDDDRVPELVAIDDSTVVLFTRNDVVLDNAAGQCVFNNAALVHSLEDISALNHGVNGVNKAAEVLSIEAEGCFADIPCKIKIASGCAANLLSQAMLKDAGCDVEYDGALDRYVIRTKSREWIFERKVHPTGRKSRYYVRDMADELAALDDTTSAVLVATVEDNLRRVTKREAMRAEDAVVLRTRLGHVSTKGMLDILQTGVNNCAVTPADVRLSEAVFGKSVAAIKGKTKKQKSVIATSVLTGMRRETQVQQTLSVDLMFIKQLAFLIGVLSPLGLGIVQHLKDKGVDCVSSALKGMMNFVSSHQFKIVEVKTDGEGAIAAMIPELHAMGIRVNPAGPGQHVPVVERMIQTVKSTVRSFEHALPYVMPRLMIIFCVLYAVRSTNFRPNAMSLDKLSPYEQFTGLKLDVKRDLRCGFGDYAQATVPVTNNTMAARTQGCICLLPTGNSTGSVKMWHLASNSVITRDQFQLLPMTGELCKYITLLAEKQGYTRGSDPGLLGSADPVDFAAAEGEAGDNPLPDMMPIDGRQLIPPALMHDAQHGMVIADAVQAVDAGVIGGGDGDIGSDTGGGGGGDLGAALEVHLPAEPRRSARLAGLGPQPHLVLFSADDALRADLCRLVLHTSDWHDPTFAFKITVRSAMRDRPAEALPVILAELEQMIRKGVWHGVRTRDLTSKQRQGIIRSSMFLKDKYLASGAFEKFKARLVAGGDQQDKGLYDNLSSPTAATASVLAVAAIAAAERRIVIITDIGGAFLNASLLPTGIKVHMRLDGTMAALLVQIAPEYAQFLEPSGCMVVELDKALYGCVEAALLWFNDLSGKLVDFGFVANPYDQCVFNKFGAATGNQITVVLHVDDLMITSIDQQLIDSLQTYLNSVYPETKSSTGPIVNYLGMCFDYSTAGEVRITMEHCVQDILASYGPVSAKPTPAASTLFDVRELAEKATEEQRKVFHTHVAKMLYLAKRVRPECLTAVSFLATRVHACDIDDLAKLKRLIGYLAGTADRGITLRIGEYMTVRGYIDAAYGVHTDSGKSHTGCAIVLGEVGALYSKSTKQKIVTKSSTEAELVGLSDTASQAIHLRNFVLCQGYGTGPAVIYQDNLSCMALMKRGGPGSERSRHINIRHFWLKERVDSGEVIVEHLGTQEMFANALTKPVQGMQFVAERKGLTGWA